ncbi:UNVERIFIED_ORG: general secretion pathway protein K [Pantoea agglomerans]
MSGKSVRKQRGVALLVVLILLVMMSALAAKISQQFCRNLQKTRYQVSQQQLRWSIQSQQKTIEDLLQTYASGESKGLSPKGEWSEPVETEGEHYTVVSQVEDAQTCFNVNNLLAADQTPAVQTAGALPEKPVKERIVEQLLTDSGISAGDAEEIYQQLLDYLDGDTTTAKEGLETDAWAGVEPARQPANQMMRTPGELKLLPAFPAAAYDKVSNLLCALPDSASKVDVNTLTGEQAPLLAALFIGSLSEDEAARLIASRPEEGWESMEAFLKELETNYPQTKDALKQVQALLAVNSNYFRVNSTGNTDDLTLRVVSQLHVDNEAGKVITWQRRYRMVE